MPPLHPLVIHFPIALYIIAVLFDGITTFTRKETLNQATRILMVFSFVGTGAAIVTGDWLKDERAAYLPHNLLKIHEALAICFGLWIFVQAIVRVRKRWRPSMTYMSFACAGVLLLAAVGHTGGAMAWPTTPKLALGPSASHPTVSTSARVGGLTANRAKGAVHTTSPSTSHNVSSSQHVTRGTTKPTKDNQQLVASNERHASSRGSLSSKANRSTTVSQGVGTNQVLLSDGATLFVERCQACHSLWTTQKWFGKLSDSQWQQIVSRMQQYGANVDSQQAQAIVNYLEHQHA